MSDSTKDIESECNARLYLADDYGDNPCTFRCRLSPGHLGEHTVIFATKNDSIPYRAMISWHEDESSKCSACKGSFPTGSVEKDLCIDCDVRECSSCKMKLSRMFFDTFYDKEKTICWVCEDEETA